MTKDQIIELIDERIKSEYRKHPDLDWSRIAAIKIFEGIKGELIEERRSCLNKDRPFKRIFVRTKHK